MRLGRVLLFTLGAMLLVAPGLAFGQTPSDTDFVEMIDPFDGDNVVEVRTEDLDTNFNMAFMLTNATVLASITIPLSVTAAAVPEVTFDPAVNDGLGNLAITHGPHGNNFAWVIRSSLLGSANQTILIGYVSFASFAPSARDTLCRIYFDVDSSGQNVPVLVDSQFLPPANQLTLTDVSALEHYPVFTKGTIQLGPVAVGDGGQTVLPLTYGLDQNFPNPFNAQTRIAFSMPKADHVNLIVYNVLGQEVLTILDKKMDANKHEIIWDGLNAQGSTVASGTYFYRLKIGDAFEETRQMTLLK